MCSRRSDVPGTPFLIGYAVAAVEVTIFLLIRIWRAGEGELTAGPFRVGYSSTTPPNRRDRFW